MKECNTLLYKKVQSLGIQSGKSKAPGAAPRLYLHIFSQGFKKFFNDTAAHRHILINKLNINVPIAVILN